MLQPEGSSRARVLVLTLVFFALGTGWGTLVLAGKTSSRASRAEQATPVQQAGPFDPSAWAWKGEEHWVVDQTARDIGEMLCIAAGEHPGSYRFSTIPDP